MSGSSSLGDCAPMLWGLCGWMPVKLVERAGGGVLLNARRDEQSRPDASVVEGISSPRNR